MGDRDMRLYWVFSWIPWESHGNGLYQGNGQLRRQNFAQGGTGAWRTGSEVRGEKVIQKLKPSGVRSAKTNVAKVFFCNSLSQ